MLAIGTVIKPNNARFQVRSYRLDVWETATLRQAINSLSVSEVSRPKGVDFLPIKGDRGALGGRLPFRR